MKTATLPSSFHEVWSSHVAAAADEGAPIKTRPMMKYKKLIAMSQTALNFGQLHGGQKRSINCVYSRFSR